MDAVQGPTTPRKNDLFTRYATNSNIERDGRWMTPARFYGEDAPQFLIARLGGNANTRVQKEEEKITREQRLAMAAGVVPKDVTEKIGEDKFINACLIGWKNVFDQDGNQFPFSKENARKLFDALPDLLEELMMFSMRAENYNAAALEGDAKN